MGTETFPIGTVARRRLYAEVSAADFQSFAQRARAEGLTIGEAISGIASAYAHGDFYLLTRDAAKNQSVNFYLKQHQREGA